MADFTSAVVEVVEEVEEIMDDAERMFEALEPKHDQEGAVSVEDIVDGIIGGELEVADFAGMCLEWSGSDEEIESKVSEEGGDEHGDVEDMHYLYVQPK